MGKTLSKAVQTFPEAKFIVHNGDLTENPEDSAGWDQFFGNVQGLLSGIPLMPVTGNHDQVDDDATDFTSHFNLPDNGAKGSIAGTSYSFDYGPVHVSVLNTESNLKKQAEWLKQDLKSTDKEWKIVAMHRPAYGAIHIRRLKIGRIFLMHMRSIWCCRVIIMSTPDPTLCGLEKSFLKVRIR